MRYIPLNAKTRDIDTGNPYWNKRYLRGVQVILSVMKGPVMVGKQFFEQAFGRNTEEFKEIILMPDEFIRNRVKPNWKKISSWTKRLMPYVKKWKGIYSKLSKSEKTELIEILSENKLSDIKSAYENINSKRIGLLLEFHLEAKNIVKNYKDAKQKT